MLGSAVSSSTPTDFQPNSVMGQLGSRPLMKCHALNGWTWACPYPAVGMQRALHSAIGLPSRSMSALWILVFLMPADVSSSFMIPLLAVVRPQSIVPVQLRTYNRRGLARAPFSPHA